MTVNESKVLKKIVQSQQANYLFEIQLESEFIASILYPTNDLYLTTGQFNVLKKFLETIGEKEFYLTQFDGGGFEGIFSESNPVCKFNLKSTYSDYCKSFLYSLSVLFSVNGTWAIFIDETLDAGYGIFASNEEYLNEFKKLYEPIKTERPEWMDEKRYVEDREYYKKLLREKNILT